MARSFRYISPSLARHIRLAMTDIDGTIIERGDDVDPPVAEAIQSLETHGIRVGLVSGRLLPRIDSLAQRLNISGPLIAENGGIARLKPGDELFKLGYTRQKAQVALEKLRQLYPEAIEEVIGDVARLVDIGIHSHGISFEELGEHLTEDVQLLDSGYMFHILQKGISKGLTLTRTLPELEEKLTPDQVIVFGDSLTDISLFQLFPESVLVKNPCLPPEQRKLLRKSAKYTSRLPFGEGFVEVALFLLQLRAQP